MTAVQRSTQSVFTALLWSMIGGALIGSFGLTSILVLEGSAYGIYERPWLMLLAPLIFAGPSLILVIPCTLVFGLPSIIAINHLNLSRWPAFAVCIAAATATQLACLRLISSGDPLTWSIIAGSSPFALGAALVLWWRLTRTPA